MENNTTLNPSDIINEQQKYIRQLLDDLSEAQIEYLEEGGAIMPLYLEDDVMKSVRFFAQKDNLTEEEFIQKACNKMLSDMEPMLNFIDYIKKNNINNEDINNLFDFIKATGKSKEIFILLSKAGFVPKIVNGNNISSDEDDLILSLNQKISNLNSEIETLKEENISLIDKANRYRKIGEGILFMFKQEADNNDDMKYQLNNRDRQIRELQSQLEQASQPEPIGDNPSYTTTAITALNHVINEFWQDWKKGTPATKQDYIVRWITDNYPEINPTMAKRIEQIARHETAK